MAGGALDLGEVRLRTGFRVRRRGTGDGPCPELLEVPVASSAGEHVQHFGLAGRFRPGGELVPQGPG